SAGLERDVRGDHARTGSGEELGVHPGAGADHENTSSGDHVAEASNASSVLLADQPAVERRRVVRSRDLELRIYVVEVVSLLPLVWIGVSRTNDRDAIAHGICRRAACTRRGVAHPVEPFVTAWANEC